MTGKRRLGQIDEFTLLNDLQRFESSPLPLYEYLPAFCMKYSSSQEKKNKKPKWMAHALLRGTLPSGPHKGVPPSGKHRHNKEFSMQYIIYRSKKKKNISWRIKMKH